MKYLAIRFYLSCGVLGGMIFILTSILQSLFRDDYFGMRYPVSSLSIGDYGWIQIVNFLVAGILCCLFARGLYLALQPYSRSLWTPFLVFAVGIGLAGAGIFPTDPVYGYPPSAPLILSQYTFSGYMHEAFSVFVFVGLPVVCFKSRIIFLKMGNHRLATYSLISGMGMLVAFFLAGAGFKQVPLLVEIAGLLQRLSITFGFSWVVVVSLHFLRMLPKPLAESRK